MLIKNSYIILIRNEKKKEKQSNTNTHKESIPHKDSLWEIITKQFEMKPSDLKLENHFKRTLTTTLYINEVSFNINLLAYEVSDVIYLDVIVEHKYKRQAIQCLEYIDERLLGKDNKFDDEYIIIISYDAVSEYYCNKIYPKLNELERTLRKLFFNIYILNFGKEYYKQTIATELQDKIKKRIGAKGGKKDIERIKYFFYSLEYSDMQSLLFDEKWLEIDSKRKDAFLCKYPDLSKLSDATLRKAYEDISPKSDWNRFFKEKIPDTNAREIIGEIQEYRNSIAHCKFLNKNEYEQCVELIQKFKVSVVKAIKVTEEKDFAKRNVTNILASVEAFSKAITLFSIELSKVITPIVQSFQATSEQMKPIFERLGKYCSVNVQNINSIEYGQFSHMYSLCENQEEDTEDNDG